MVRVREIQGQLDRYGFVHANPANILQRLTPSARDMLRHLRLLNYMINLTKNVGMDLVIRAQSSYDPDRKSISIMGLNKEPRELFLTTGLLSQALGIPEGGLLTRKTEKTQDRCIPYF